MEFRNRFKPIESGGAAAFMTFVGEFKVCSPT